jgi:electron transport complex protein RnfD
VITVGTFFAVVFVKQLYGGLGQNLFNPAMAAYILLLISFPVQMTAWLPELSLQPIALSFTDQIHFFLHGISIDGYSLSQLSVSIDGLTMATPLNTVKNGLHSGFTLSEIANSPIGSLTSASEIAWINLAFFFGGIALFVKGVIHWHIPVAFLAGIILFSFIGFAFDPDLIISPLFHLFSGATMLGAFFILTDPVSAATTPKGRIIYALTIALIVVIIRNIGGYPDAVAFAVLFGNMCVPLIDYYTKPRVYGSK